MNIKLILRVVSSSLMVARHGVLLYKVLKGDIGSCTDTVSDIISSRDPQKFTSELYDTVSEVCPKDD
jgi:cell division septation protein DedD